MKFRKYSYRFFYVLFLAIILIVVSTALVIYFSQQQAIKDEKSNELSTLHKLKVKQYLDWKGERMSDALFLKNNPDFIYRFEQLLKTPENISYRKNLIKASKSIINAGHYKSMVFLDKAVQGKEGVVNAVDYRNKKNLAAVGPVTGTDWFLIVKKDASEVYGEFRKVAIGTWTISILLIVAGFLTLHIFWLKRIATHEKEKLYLEYNYELINHKYRLVSKYANDAILLWDGEHKILDFNDRALELYGYEAGEMTGLKKEQLRPEKFRKVLKDITNLLEYTVGKRYETMHRGKDGKVFPVEITTPCFTIDSKIHYLSIIRDITDRKNAENAIRESEERLRLALKSAKQGMYDLNIQTGEVVVSPEYETMLGYEPGELQETNKKWQERLHPEDREMTYKMFEDYVAGKINDYHAEFRQKTKTGDWIWTLSLGEIVSWDNLGKPLKMLGTHTDITRLKLAEDEIVKLNAVLEQKVFERTSQLTAKNRELESFAYSVSHDLKAPLRGIDGYSRILMEEYSEELNDKAKEYIDNIMDNAMEMNRLIDDLLEYSRIERYPVNTGTLNLKYTVVTTLDQILKEYPDNRIIPDIQVPETEITTNANGLTIALRNLIENAVKFTKTADDPKIEIGFEEKDGSYVLYVSDNGIGFDMQHHDRIFEIFHRLQRVEDYPGTGIGLAMVKKAMERMGGKVWAESSPGKGSVFYLEIPKN